MKMEILVLRFPATVAICAALSLAMAALQARAQTASVAVTSLNDNGPGTLREAVKSGNRTVQFRVGGDFQKAEIRRRDVWHE